MKANLMLVSNDDFPVRISEHLNQHEFICFFARGRLKINEIFGQEKIEAIIWIFKDYDEGLAGDLIKAFNTQNHIPLILITEAYGNSDISDIVEGVYAHHDINDGLQDIRKSIESACNLQNTSGLNETYRIDIPEIDFKNAVRHLITEQESTSLDNTLKGTLVLETPWSAVSKKEKSILSSGTGAVEEMSILDKIKECFKK